MRRTEALSSLYPKYVRSLGAPRTDIYSSLSGKVSAKDSRRKWHEVKDHYTEEVRLELEAKFAEYFRAALRDLPKCVPNFPARDLALLLRSRLQAIQKEGDNLYAIGSVGYVIFRLDCGPNRYEIAYTVPCIFEQSELAKKS